jgi:hypothetical protein
MAAMAIACFLASRGAPHHVRNRAGKTPLDLITNPSWKAKVLFYAQLAEDTSEHPAAAAVEASPSSSGAVDGAAAQVAVADGAAAVVEDASDASASAAAMAIVPGWYQNTALNLKLHYQPDDDLTETGCHFSMLKVNAMVWRDVPG